MRNVIVIVIVIATSCLNGQEKTCQNNKDNENKNDVQSFLDRFNWKKKKEYYQLQNAILRIGNVGDEKVILPLWRYWKGKSIVLYPVCRNAIIKIAKRMPEKSSKILHQLYLDSEPSDRYRILEIVVEMRATPLVYEILTLAIKSPFKGIISKSANALTKLYPEENTSSLLCEAYLRNSYTSVRIGLAQNLGILNNKTSKSFLLSVFKDTKMDKRLRNSIAVALAKLNVSEGEQYILNYINTTIDFDNDFFHYDVLEVVEYTLKAKYILPLLNSYIKGAWGNSEGDLLNSLNRLCRKKPELFYAYFNYHNAKVVDLLKKIFQEEFNCKIPMNVEKWKKHIDGLKKKHK